MSLHELQNGFVRRLFNHGGGAFAALHVRNQGSLNAAQRVGIYANSVHGILTQSLSAIYAVCQELVGEDFFAALCTQFIDRQPPHTPFLSEYGSHMADFMQDYPELENLPWLADVARLEWARHAVWHAPNQPAGDFVQLAALDETQQAGLRLEMPVSAQLMESRFAVDQVWLAHQKDSALALEEVRINDPARVVVWRAGRNLKQASLTQAQQAFLRDVRQGQTLAELTERYAEALSPLLATAVQSGWIISYRLRGE